MRLSSRKLVEYGGNPNAGTPVGSSGPRQFGRQHDLSRQSSTTANRFNSTPGRKVMLQITTPFPISANTRERCGSALDWLHTEINGRINNQVIYIRRGIRTTCLPFNHVIAKTYITWQFGKIDSAKLSWLNLLRNHLNNIQYFTLSHSPLALELENFGRPTKFNSIKHYSFSL